MTEPGEREKKVREMLGQHEAGFKSLLLPQERLLTQIDFSLADGKNKLETPPDTRSGGRKAAETAAAVVLETLMPSPPSLKRMMGGVSASGRVGSWAYRLVEASRGLLGKNRTQDLMITDRRLLLASSKIWGKDRDYAVELEIPRDALAQAEVEGRPLARGRVAISFTDGSMVALGLNNYRTEPAQELVRALTGPGTA